MNRIEKNILKNVPVHPTNKRHQITNGFINMFQLKVLKKTLSKNYEKMMWSRINQIYY